MKGSISILFFSFCLMATGQLPVSRQVDWAQAGSEVSLDNLAVRNVIDVVNDLGLDSSGTTDNTALLQSAFNAVSSATVFFFPPGDYLFESRLVVKNNCILKGVSPSETGLIFNLSTVRECFRVSGGASGSYYPVDSGISKNSMVIRTTSATGFNPGDYLEIRQRNDSSTWDVEPESWAQYAIGQVIRIQSVSGNRITLTEALTFEYNTGLKPTVRKVNPRKNVGFETLRVTRSDDVGDATSRATFFFNYATNCWIKGVESVMASHQHVETGRSSHLTVSGCYFNDAHRHNNTGGAKGYGLNLIHHTTKCLFENNIFRYLRHSISVKIGSNANVIAYNYSLDRKSQECVLGFCLWLNDKSDLNFHGHYPHSNLMEGNIVEFIRSDIVYGIAGPGNTLMRNRSTDDGLVFSNHPSAIPDEQNTLGNEVMGGGNQYNMGSGVNHYECNNNDGGILKGTDCLGLSDQSLYLLSAPDFWNISDSWPSIGGSNSPGSGTIPAKARFENANMANTFPGQTDLCENGSVYYDEDLERFRWCENRIWVIK